MMHILGVMIMEGGEEVVMMCVFFISPNLENEKSVLLIRDVNFA